MSLPSRAPGSTSIRRRSMEAGTGRTPWASSTWKDWSRVAPSAPRSSRCLLAIVLATATFSLSSPTAPSGDATSRQTATLSQLPETTPTSRSAGSPSSRRPDMPSPFTRGFQSTTKRGFKGPKVKRYKPRSTRGAKPGGDAKPGAGAKPGLGEQPVAPRPQVRGQHFEPDAAYLNTVDT